MRYVLGSFTLALLVAAIVIGAPARRSSAAAAQDVQVIEIVAERFSFTPSEIRVKAGTRLEIRLRSEDTVHGFHIVGTDINLELPKRGRGDTTVMFQPQAGRYTFECSHLCGAGHSFMRGVIIATN
ncbi:MAG: cbaB 2 [Acidobacteria bacterium]|nr:cbaB 2 [Acidobacteriota bacterium]